MPFFTLAQVSLNENISVGNVLTLAILVGMFFFIWIRTKRDVELSTLNHWIKRHEEDSAMKDARLRMVENAIIQLTAIQESMREHFNTIDRRHERCDEIRSKAV